MARKARGNAVPDWRKTAALLLLPLLFGGAVPASAACNAAATEAMQRALDRAAVFAWDDAIAAFAAIRAADPACSPPTWPSRALDRLQYADLQTGRDEAARALIAEGGARTGAVLAARYALERNAWDEAAALPLPTTADAEAQATVRYARALGAARRGKAAAAALDIAALDRIVGGLAGEAGQRLGNAAEAAKAWIALAGGASGAALARLRVAAEREDAGAGGGVAANPLLPLRELLADMLFETGDFAGAVREYEMSLKAAPRRMRAYWAAGRAAESAGNREATRRLYGDFAALCEAASCIRPGRLTALKRSMAAP